MKISGGLTENGIVVGNTYDKYDSGNFIVRRLMNGFQSDLTELIDQVQPALIHEVGCGEGYWILRWTEQGIAARGSDFSHTVIRLARSNAKARRLPEGLFETRSIYDLQPPRDSAELIVCCEVLEHLESPEKALLTLQTIAKPYLILSVPREPLWSLMNMARGKYLFKIGCTPGHIQQWSKGTFIELVSCYFEVKEIRTPLPWTMLLCRVKSEVKGNNG